MTFCESMQQKNATFGEFLRRTDILALRLGVDLHELADQIGVARGSLSSFRSGKRPISNKTWMRLEEVERASGNISKNPASDGINEESTSKLNDITLSFGKKNGELDMDRRIAALENKVAILECALGSLLSGQSNLDRTGKNG